MTSPTLFSRRALAGILIALFTLLAVGLGFNTPPHPPHPASAPSSAPASGPDQPPVYLGE